ncbi:MAG TPA: cbb3-type cytochrome c oxidase N-terminal domain-containing protein [Thermodesulfobacteriota bacterium]|nr:cbb3-type cytochrome c oxidase N-terminal domain-containing protein [Thermodesulfobacteriota bacterium]
MADKIGHSIDGIEEYDNPIPAWLMWLLYATIAFAVGYWVIYPGFWPGTAGWSQAKMYDEEVRVAETKYAEIRKKESDIYAILKNPAALAEGKEIYAQNCSPCHGVEAKGDTGIGPNLTDTEWLYGGTPEAIVKTITDGTAKGMPPWGPQIGPVKVAKVSAYVHTLGGGQ